MAEWFRRLDINNRLEINKWKKIWNGVNVLQLKRKEKENLDFVVAIDEWEERSEREEWKFKKKKEKREMKVTRVREKRSRH